jgi:hypothetical protein
MTTAERKVAIVVASRLRVDVDTDDYDVPERAAVIDRRYRYKSKRPGLLPNPAAENSVLRSA